MVSFTLLENALDSVEIGLEYFRKSRESQNRRDYKQCLLNLFQAAELLLKAAVSRQDAGRIFTQKSLKKHCKDPACPTESELHRCQSVKISELCELIKTHHRSEFSDHGLQLMRAVAQMRNNLQHFALEISPQSLAMQLSELYKLIFRPAFILLQADKEHNSRTQPRADNLLIWRLILWRLQPRMNMCLHFVPSAKAGRTLLSMTVKVIRSALIVSVVISV